MRNLFFALTALFATITMTMVKAQLPEGSFLSDVAIPTTPQQVGGESQFIIGEKLRPDESRRAYTTHCRSTNVNDNKVYTAYLSNSAMPFDPGSSHFRMTAVNVDISWSHQYLAYGYIVRIPKYLGTYTQAGKTSYVYAWEHELVLSSLTPCSNCKGRGATSSGRTSMY